MTVADYYHSNVPEYYPWMYRDGYDPYQILHAKRQQMFAELEAAEVPEVKFTCEVKIR